MINDTEYEDDSIIKYEDVLHKRPVYNKEKKIKDLSMHFLLYNIIFFLR